MKWFNELSGPPYQTGMMEIKLDENIKVDKTD